MDDDLAPRLGTADVALLADRVALRQSDVADAGVVRYEVGDGVGAVVHDDELAVGQVLAKEAADGVGHEEPPVVRRHDARNQGPPR